MGRSAGMVSISNSINSMEAANQFIHWLHQYHSVVKSMHIRCNVSSVTAAHQISQWLQQHYYLLHSLHLRFGAYMLNSEQQTAAAVVASAMQQALGDRAVSSSHHPTAGYMQHSAQAGAIVGSSQATAAAAAPRVNQLQATATAVAVDQAPILQLQELGLILPEPMAALPDADPASIVIKLLQPMSINQLTRLQLQCCWGGYNPSDGGVMTKGHAIQQALAPLTALRSLLLEHTSITESMPVLEKLTHLTELQLKPTVMGVASLQYLPASLVKLVIPELFRIYIDISTPAVIDQPPIDLQHCTALSHLTLGITLQHDDCLPTTSGLVELSINGYESVQPLMQLQQLQRLEVLRGSSHNLELITELNSCSNLTDIKIVCHDGLLWEPARAVSALGQVTALRELQLGRTCPSCAPMQHFSSLSQISKLNFAWHG